MSFFQILLILRRVFRRVKFGCHFFSYQSLLLSTRVLNDIYIYIYIYSTRNVRWLKKTLIGIKNPYSGKALVITSISTISHLQIELSLFYPNAENIEIRYNLFGKTRTNVFLVGESIFGHILMAFSLYKEWQSTTCKVQPITTLWT